MTPLARIMRGLELIVVLLALAYGGLEVREHFLNKRADQAQQAQAVADQHAKADQNLEAAYAKRETALKAQIEADGVKISALESRITKKVSAPVPMPSPAPAPVPAQPVDPPVALPVGPTDQDRLVEALKGKIDDQAKLISVLTLDRDVAKAEAQAHAQAEMQLHAQLAAREGLMRAERWKGRLEGALVGGLVGYVGARF